MHEKPRYQRLSLSRGGFSKTAPERTRSRTDARPQRWEGRFWKNRPYFSSFSYTL